MDVSLEGTGMSSSSPLWRPDVQFRHIAGNSVQLETLNDSGGIPVELSVTPKMPVHIVLEGNQGSSLSVWTTLSRSGFRSEPKLPADLITIRFVDRGSMSRNGTRGNSIAVGFGQALFTSFMDLRHEQASPGFSAITATITRDTMMAAYRAMTGTDATVLPQFDQVVDVRTFGLATLRRTLTILRDQPFARLREGDMMAPLLRELLVYQFINAWPTIGPAFESQAASSTDRSVKTAIDYIESNLGQKLAIFEIANAAGLSVRGLQIAFKRRLGCSPVQYLIARRLDQVHSALQAGEGATIRQIALDWGFVHMSDFARRYRERFGRTPMAMRANLPELR